MSAGRYEVTSKRDLKDAIHWVAWWLDVLPSAKARIHSTAWGYMAEVWLA